MPPPPDGRPPIDGNGDRLWVTCLWLAGSMERQVQSLAGRGGVDVRRGGMGMKEDLAVRGGGGRVNAVVVRLDRGCLN